MVLEKLDLFAKDGVHLLNAGASLFCSCTTNDVQMAKFATDVKANLYRYSARGIKAPL